MATESAVRDALLLLRRPAPPALLVGPGDDAAVLSLDPWKDARLVVTSDGLEEGVHFRAGWQDIRDLGWKILAVNLSDLAAMGAEPFGYVLAVAWPHRLPQIEAQRLGEALRNAEDEHGLVMLGGDTDVTDGPLRLTATLLGRVREPGPHVRSGGRAGDTLFVSGPLGGAAAVWTRLDAGGLIPEREDPDWADAARRFRRPTARLELGRALLGRAHAVMDLSDGLITDLRRLAAASGLAAEVVLDTVPIHPAARLAGKPRRLALFGGEDYELLVAGPEALGDEQPGLVAVGRLVEGEAGQVDVHHPDGARRTVGGRP